MNPDDRTPGILRRRIADKVLRFLDLVADLGYVGLHSAAIVVTRSLARPDGGGGVALRSTPEHVL